MAKNTHAQEIVTGTSDSYTDQEHSDPSLPSQIKNSSDELTGRVSATESDAGEGELELAGGNSKASSRKESHSSGNENPSHQPRARTTVSRLPQQAQATDSGATTTGGAIPNKQAKQSGKH